ncbi:MAG: hypothetical protein D3904_17700, partial [Candidatus Electrothrix sp. EH2]|nr:hypothetical protein [Candidatus Electrothrix sp. EH2]
MKCRHIRDVLFLTKRIYSIISYMIVCIIIRCILEVTPMPATDYLSATALAKKTAAALDSLEQGEKDKLIIL